MKQRALWVVLMWVCGATTYATVDWTFSYDVYLYSSYLKDGTDYVKMEQAHNEDVSTFYSSGYTPYNGGSDFRYREDIEKFQLAAVYLNRTGISNWTTNDLIGTLSVGTSATFPAGSLVPFEVDYWCGTESSTVFPLVSAGISFWNSDFTQELYCNDSQVSVIDLVYLTAGQDYGFYAWYTAGGAAQRFSGQFAGGIQYNFEVVPEPATAALLMLGIAALAGNADKCKRRERS